MAMNKKDKPLRPNPLKATLRGSNGMAPLPVKVVPKKPLTKPVVKNPSAPKGTGSGAAKGSVKVMTKTESMLKKGKDKTSNTGSKPAPKTLKKVSEIDKMINNTQGFRGRSPRGGGGINGGPFGIKNR